MPNFLKCFRYIYKDTSARGFSSKAICTSWFIYGNWAIHESPGRKSDL